MSAFRVFTLLSVVLALTSVCCFSSVPTIISYQGKLMQPSGAPVPDSTYQMTFAIYDVPNGGTALWSETASVQVKGGLYSVLLGSVTPIPASMFSGPNRWFGIKVGSDPEMTPRQQIASVGYSFMSAVAQTVEDGAITSDKLAPAAVTPDRLAIQQRVVVPVNAEFSGTLTSTWTKVVDVKSPVYGLRGPAVDDTYTLFGSVSRLRVYLGLYASFGANPSTIQARVRWFNGNTGAWGYSEAKTGRPLYSFGRNPHIIGYWEDVLGDFGGPGIGTAWWQFEIRTSAGDVDINSLTFLVLEPIL